MCPVTPEMCNQAVWPRPRWISGGGGPWLFLGPAPRRSSQLMPSKRGRNRRTNMQSVREQLTQFPKCFKQVRGAALRIQFQATFVYAGVAPTFPQIANCEVELSMLLRKGHRNAFRLLRYSLHSAGGRLLNLRLIPFNKGFI